MVEKRMAYATYSQYIELRGEIFLPSAILEMLNICSQWNQLINIRFPIFSSSLREIFLPSAYFPILAYFRKISYIICINKKLEVLKN